MILSRGPTGNKREIVNWGLRHHIRPDSEYLKLNQSHADWLGMITVQTSL